MQQQFSNCEFTTGLENLGFLRKSFFGFLGYLGF